MDVNRTESSPSVRLPCPNLEFIDRTNAVKYSCIKTKEVSGSHSGRLVRALATIVKAAGSKN
jgi:hypothetical protein